jgi:hypothetical protein
MTSFSPTNTGGMAGAAVVSVVGAGVVVDNDARAAAAAAWTSAVAAGSMIVLVDSDDDEAAPPPPPPATTPHTEGGAVERGEVGGEEGRGGDGDGDGNGGGGSAVGVVGAAVLLAATPATPADAHTGNSTATEAVANLTAMGFSVADAQLALQACDGDVVRALDMILIGNLPVVLA